MRKEIIRIDCYLAQDCGSQQALQNSIDAALRLENAKAEVSFSRVTESEAEELGLRGSPSVLVDGQDILPSNLSGFS
ncbi:MAG TPA: hypothetical protein VK463_06265 [Desulfomonilaceae bacterium]|nr:hypothetical protein [Desulfomonilaceae bacterium]